ncbi:hypothetical protein M2326_003528, partial [Flavobacterium sp. 7A]|nr:hypothetical protein [Flavobacterium sp. 7A]
TDPEKDLVLKVQMKFLSKNLNNVHKVAFVN